MIVAILNNEERIENIQNVRVTQNNAGDDIVNIEYISEFGSTMFSTSMQELKLNKEN